MESHDENYPGNRNSKCKGPGVRNVVELRNHEKVSVLGK